MERLPLYLGLFLAGLGLFILSDGFEIDLFGSRAAGQLAAARVEIGLARAEHRAAMREIRQVKKDHDRIFKMVEEAYFGCHSVTRERKNEKAVPPVGKR